MRGESEKAPASSLQSLVGEETSGIAFVRDYVELHFEGTILRLLTPATLTNACGQWRFPAPGFRDALCDLIGQRVERVQGDLKDALLLLFDSGSTLRVPLDDAGRSQGDHGECVHFVQPGKTLMIW